MKKLLTILLFLCSASVFAQDVIVKKDGSTIVCRVEKVGDADVTYKLWSDLKGSSYVMDKSLVSAINYENGRKETFAEREIEVKDDDEGKPSMSDAKLLELDERLHPYSIPSTITIAEKEMKYKKVKRLKTWGWIGGGILAAGGVVFASMGLFMEDDDEILMSYGVTGAALFALGAGVTTTCLIVAHNQKKKIDALQTSAIYRYDIPFSNGSRLSVGADMLNDRIMNKRTVGLGLTYNF